jgi:hypothetical protein
VTEIWTKTSLRLKANQEFKEMSIENYIHQINSDYEPGEQDNSVNSQVKSLFHSLSVDFIAKLALFYICRKCDFMQQTFVIFCILLPPSAPTSL